MTILFAEFVFPLEHRRNVCFLHILRKKFIHDAAVGDHDDGLHNGRYNFLQDIRCSTHGESSSNIYLHKASIGIYREQPLLACVQPLLELSMTIHKLLFLLMVWPQHSLIYFIAPLVSSFWPIIHCYKSSLIQSILHVVNSVWKWCFAPFHWCWNFWRRTQIAYLHLMLPDSKVH